MPMPDRAERHMMRHDQPELADRPPQQVAARAQAHGLAIRDNKLWSEPMLPGQTDWSTIPTILPSSGDVTHHPFNAKFRSRDEIHETSSSSASISAATSSTDSSAA